MKMLSTAPQENRESGSQPLLVINLLNDLDGLAGLLQTELERGSWLNAYLLAAGMGQVAQDHVQADRYLLRKAGEYLALEGNPLGVTGLWALRAVDNTSRALRRIRSPDRLIERWVSDLLGLADQLALAVLTGGAPQHDRDAIAGEGRRVLEGCRALPTELRRAVVRLPSCFRSFDQQPEDMERLARKFAAIEPDRMRPIAVVGVRTSGSYLGPLVAASLRTQGFHDVVALTVRPGSPVGSLERKALRRIKQRRGLALVVDDPPTTGHSLNMAARELIRLGVRPEAVILLVPLLAGADDLPEAIERQHCVVLEWAEWSIHDRLADHNVRAALDSLVGPDRAVAFAERTDTDKAGRRGHVQARYRVTLVDRFSGKRTNSEVHVSGVGLGYFCGPSLAVVERLRGFLPYVYGVDGGLLFRDWMPGAQFFDPTAAVGDSEVIDPFVGYVLARSSALRVPEDTARRLRGRLPVWEAASNLISRAFGRAWAWARIPLVDPVVKECLRVDTPSLIDGSMDPDHWFVDSRPPRLVKVDFDRRAFANLDLACFDAVYDLACLAADMEVATVSRVGGAVHPGRFRAAFENAGGPPISAERWFLLQLVHLWDRLRLGEGAELALRRAMSRAAQRYFAEIFFQGVTSGGEGPLCALDLDGVLETETIGMSSLTSSSAVALQALLRHRYRPVLMTGRSLDEVRERCGAFNLAGGVAEYGSVVYDHVGRDVTSTVSERQLRDLARAREAVERLAGMSVDHAYGHSVRAYYQGTAGERRAPPVELIERTLGPLGLNGLIEVIPGDSQVDLIAAGVSKAAALVTLAKRIGTGSPDGAMAIALAVGDRPPDISAFSLARLAVAPAHAPRAVRAAATRPAPRPYQAGFADAVEDLLGHRPGSCPVCRTPAMPSTRADLLALISAQERGVRSMAGVSAHLLASALRRAARA